MEGNRKRRAKKVGRRDDKKGTEKERKSPRTRDK
jgi:hypothetical protein